MVLKTVSLKLPTRLSDQLERAAKLRGESKSQVMRDAIEHYLNGGGGNGSKRPLSALDLAGDIVGCLAGPGDLSTNPRYMEGFGE